MKNSRIEHIKGLVSMSLVDRYHDRVFRNGRVYGVGYNEMTDQPTYSDISPFGSGRMAGSGLDLEPDIVIYMGKAAQGMPQDKSMDVRIAEGMLKAFGRAIEPQLAGGNFMGGSASQIAPRPKGLKGITREALESLPNSGIAKDKYLKIRQGIDLPRV